MSTIPGSVTNVAQSATHEHLTLGWFARRTGLLVLILASGIGAACCLYAFAGDEPGAQASKPDASAIETGSPRG